MKYLIIPIILIFFSCGHNYSNKTQIGNNESIVFSTQPESFGHFDLPTISCSTKDTKPKKVILSLSLVIKDEPSLLYEIINNSLLFNKTASEIVSNMKYIELSNSEGRKYLCEKMRSNFNSTLKKGKIQEVNFIDYRIE